MLPEKPIPIELHNFLDTSTSGNGECSYICCLKFDGWYACNLVLGKSRVAPLKFVAVPRLKLLQHWLLK